MATGVQNSTPGAETPRHQPEVGMLNLFWRYASYGFRHIIPKGLDHCAFVLGLFLLSPRWKPVLLQITTFTIAHTVTLTLTSLHVIGLPSSFIEPAIAISVAFIGIENLVTTKVHPWRPAIAFFFGLVHGMGVATAFNEAPFPPGHLVPSLAAFTVGVEAGHVAVLTAAFLALGWFRDKPWYRARIAIPLSVLIAVIALIWTGQRLWPGAGA
jgi:hydrogenase/urease accessory protein HupE